jgi:hypothetical protein
MPIDDIFGRYDFDLRTGKSDTGLKACTYAVDVKTDPCDGVDKVHIEVPEHGHNWRLVELRPVSEGGFFVSDRNVFYSSCTQNLRIRRHRLPRP